MKTSYHLQIQCKCPADATVTDDYQMVATVENRLITAEDLKTIVANATASPQYQEDLCKHLSSLLHAEVSLHGTHQGVTIHCVARDGQ